VCEVSSDADTLFFLALSCSAPVAHRRAAETRIAAQRLRWTPYTRCSLAWIRSVHGEQGAWNLLHPSPAGDVVLIANRLLPARVDLCGHYGSVSNIDALTALLLCLVDTASLLAYEALVGFAEFKQSAIIRATACLLVQRHGHLLHTPM